MNVLFNRPTDPAARHLRERMFNSLDLEPHAWIQLLNLADIEVTTKVATAAVTCTDPPVLRFNPDFVAKHCPNDNDLLLLVSHELYHVTLGHTRLAGWPTPLDNLVFDIVINAMLSHTVGRRAGVGLLQRYYPFDRFPDRLLRPPPGWPDSMAAVESLCPEQQGLIKLLYDDPAQGGSTPGCQATYGEVRRMLTRICRQQGKDGEAACARVILLGSHPDAHTRPGDPEPRPAGTPPNTRATGHLQPFKQWVGQRFGDLPGARLVRPEHSSQSSNSAPPGHNQTASLLRVPPDRPGPAHPWVHPLERALRKLGALLAGESRHGRQQRILDRPLPLQSVLPSARDRRVHALADLLGQTPLYQWSAVAVPAPEMIPVKQVHVYLDTSASISNHLPALTSVLAGPLRRGRIRLFAFSNIVAEWRSQRFVEQGADSTGGTDINCVLQHLARQPATRRPRAALVLTDGLIDFVDLDLKHSLKEAGVHIEGLLVNGQPLRTQCNWADDFAVLPGRTPPKAPPPRRLRR